MVETKYVFIGIGVKQKCTQFVFELFWNNSTSLENMNWYRCVNVSRYSSPSHGHVGWPPRNWPVWREKRIRKKAPRRTLANIYDWVLVILTIQEEI
jgi:hypothetical protein